MTEVRTVPNTPPASIRLMGIVAFAVLFVLTDVFYLFPGLDLAVSRLFYADGHFLASTISGFVALRQFGIYLFELALILAAAGLIVPVIFSGARLPFGPRWSLFFLLTSALGPGLIVNALLKDHWGRARPLSLVEFGGSSDFSPVWVISDACSSNCSFVSGEASSAMALMALVALAPPRWRRATAFIVLALTFAFSLNRIAFGGHFLSDVLLAWCLTIIVMAICAEVVLRLDEDRLSERLGQIGASVRRRLAAVLRRG